MAAGMGIGGPAGGLLNGKPAYSFRTVDGGVLQPTVFPNDAFNSPGIPKGVTRKFELPHGEVRFCSECRNVPPTKLFLQL